jgi:hypothetical protein
MLKRHVTAMLCILVVQLCPPAHAADDPDMAAKLDLAARELRATNVDLAHYSRLPSFEWRLAAAEMKDEIASADRELARSVAETLTLEELQIEVRFHESAAYQEMQRKTEARIRYSDEEIQAYETFRASAIDKEVNRKIGTIAPRLSAIMQPVVTKMVGRAAELSALSKDRQPIRHVWVQPPIRVAGDRI